MVLISGENYKSKHESQKIISGKMTKMALYLRKFLDDRVLYKIME